MSSFGSEMGKLDHIAQKMRMRIGADVVYSRFNRNGKPRVTLICANPCAIYPDSSGVSSHRDPTTHVLYEIYKRFSWFGLPERMVAFIQVNFKTRALGAA